jgi:hypothetical protein
MRINRIDALALHCDVVFASFILSIALTQIPGTLSSDGRPASSTAPPYFEFLEENAHVIYPVIAIVVLGLIAAGLVSAWRTHDSDGILKAELKRALIHQLRREVHGATAEQLAKTLGLPSLKTLKLLEELQAEKLAECRTDTRRITTWRLRGLVER